MNSDSVGGVFLNRKQTNFFLILFIVFIVAEFIKTTNGNVVQASSLPNEAHVAVLDCSKKYPNVYYDLAKKEWSVHLDKKCFSTEKDLLDLCRLVYPKLNVVNIMRLDEPVKFTVYGCTIGGSAVNSKQQQQQQQQQMNKLTADENDKLKNCSKLKITRVNPYKCLHGEFQSSELYIPPKCQFQHLYSNDGCQSQDHWNLLSAEKCKSSAGLLNSSMLLQWCDASNGISTFSGIEFVCCPKQDQDQQQQPQLDQQQQQQQDQQQQQQQEPKMFDFEDEDIDDDEDGEDTIDDSEMDDNDESRLDDTESSFTNDGANFKLDQENTLINGQNNEDNYNKEQQQQQQQDDYDLVNKIDDKQKKPNLNEFTSGVGRKDSETNIDSILIVPAATKQLEQSTTSTTTTTTTSTTRSSITSSGINYRRTTTRPKQVLIEQQQQQQINTNEIKKIIEKYFDLHKEEHNDLEAVEGTKEQKEQYEKQKQFIINSIQSSLDDLLREKENDRTYLADKKDKVSQKLLDSLNTHLQTSFNRLNDEKNRLLLQEEISYEQQVQGRLNEKKLNSIKDLNRVMQELENKSVKDEQIAQLDDIVKSLYEFYMAQESDRLHMVTVYKKLKAYFPEQLKERAQSIRNHFESIDRTINETFNIFRQKFPRIAKSVLEALNQHFKRYEQVRSDSKLAINDLKNIKLLNIIKTDDDLAYNNKKQETIKILDLKKKTKQNYKSVAGGVTPTTPSTRSTIIKQVINTADATLNNNNNNNDDLINSNYNYDDNDSDDDIDDSYDAMDKQSLDQQQQQQQSDDINKSIDSLLTDDETKSKQTPSLIDEVINDSINIKRLNIADSNLSKLCVIIAISLGIFFSLILIFAMIRRKRLQSQHTIKHGFVPVDTSNPEDRHISNMQVNGYENPTYKFFENSTLA